MGVRLPAFSLPRERNPPCENAGLSIGGYGNPLADLVGAGGSGKLLPAPRDAGPTAERKGWTCSSFALKAGIM